MRIMRMDGKESHTTFPHTPSHHQPRPPPQGTRSTSIFLCFAFAIVFNYFCKGTFFFPHHKTNPPLFYYPQRKGKIFSTCLVKKCFMSLCIWDDLQKLDERVSFHHHLHDHAVFQTYNIQTLLQRASRLSINCINLIIVSIGHQIVNGIHIGE